MQESMASANKSLTRFQLRKIAKEAKSFMVENKASAAFLVVIPASQFEFLSTILKDGLMTGIGVAATPSSDVHI